MPIRDDILEAMKRWEIDVGELSRLTGISRSMVWRYVEGKADLSGVKLDLVLDALNLYVTPRASRTKWSVTLKEPSKRSKIAKRVKKIIMLPRVRKGTNDIFG